ncbi:MAG TPA: type VI secretion system tube protein TssD, partial [Hymenobacter sp.]
VTFSFRQAIGPWGRPSSDVRIELLKVTLTGEPAGWKIWPELKLDDFRRVSGWVLYFDNQGRTAKRYAFYDAALISLEFRYDGRGMQGKQAATQVELHFSPATVEVNGQRLEAYSRIPWKTNPQTSFRVLTKPPDPQPSPHLAALLATARRRRNSGPACFRK